MCNIKCSHIIRQNVNAEVYDHKILPYNVLKTCTEMYSNWFMRYPTNPIISTL